MNKFSMLVVAVIGLTLVTASLIVGATSSATNGAASQGQQALVTILDADGCSVMQRSEMRAGFDRTTSLSQPGWQLGIGDRRIPSVLKKDVEPNHKAVAALLKRTIEQSDVINMEELAAEVKAAAMQQGE